MKFKIKNKGKNFIVGQMINFYDHTDSERKLSGYISNVEGDIATIASYDYGYINKDWRVRLEIPNYFDIVEEVE